MLWAYDVSDSLAIAGNVGLFAPLDDGERFVQATASLSAAIALTDKEFHLLRVLLDVRGEVVTREALLAEIWGMDFDPGTGVVKTQVAQLRTKLGRVGIPIRVENVRGVGYRISEEAPPTTRA